MKTKIIYISGGEVFDMADVRAAFEEVRTTLGLDSDTIMFGVPVDADDALATAHTATNVADAVTDATHDVDTTVTDTDAHANIDVEHDDAPQLPKKKSARGGKKSADKAIKSEPDAATTPITPEHIDADIATISPSADEPVIPILSVLAAADDTAPADEAVVDDAPTMPDMDVIAPTDNVDVADNAVMAAEPMPDDDMTKAEMEIQSVSIDDMVADDTPAVTHEKTLEELLESMAPLSEDNITPPAASVSDIPDTVDPVVSPDVDSDSDATLEQLATEFAASRDKIPTASKNDGHGKIGKLKNILPFKKVRREDTGLMGDLFGWAGIAANDEDFAMPGFFTTSASKK